jgi:hypothetical protein
MLCLSISSLVFAAESALHADDASKFRTDRTFGQLPLYFIENRGQLYDEVSYYVQGADRTLYFTETGITFSKIVGPKSDSGSGCGLERHVLKLDFAGAKRKRPRGLDRQKARFSYFKGKQEDWNAGCPAFGSLVYEDLWTGIDLRYSGTVNRLKYEFIVKPGADPSRIRLAYRGADTLEIKPSGALGVRAPGDEFEDGKPFAYQETADGRSEVSMSYRLFDEGEEGSSCYGFDVGTYDRTKTLVLDPVIIVYCGYIGGLGMEFLNGIALDDEGCVYVGGYTGASELTFPVVTGPDLTYNNGYDVFVAKVSADGTHLIYCGYIGGVSGDEGMDIALDDQKNLYVVGQTRSTETTFPVKTGPDLTFNDREHNDLFVAKVNAQGTDLDYCGYIGGVGYEMASGVAVDGQGRAIVTGWALTTESSFPVKVGPDLTHNGGYDAFVAAVSSDGARLEFCGYVGGAGTDESHGIAVDDEGNAFLTGHTSSDETTFPVLRGPDLTHNGGIGYHSLDAWVAKVDDSGTFLHYCGYIGGSKRDDGMEIAVNGAGNAFITGDTKSPRASFPVKKGPDLTYNGEFDGFVARVKVDGSGLDYCGYVGGSGYEYLYDIAVDDHDCAHVAGRTNSTESTFPVVYGPDLTANGGEDAFLAKVSADGTAFELSGFFGGIDYDRITGVALNDVGMIFVAGFTMSDEVTEGFPLSVGPDLTYNGQNPFDADGFVAKLTLPLVSDAQVLSESAGGKVNFFLNAGADNGGRDYLLLGGVSGTEPGYPLPGGQVTLPLNFDVLTYTILGLLNTALFDNFLGTLDSFGAAEAQLDSPPLPTGYVGVKIHFAYCLNDPYDFVSNPLDVEIVN